MTNTPEEYKEWEYDPTNSWQCKYCKERFDKQDESQSWQLHKIGHKLTEIEGVLRLIASALRHEILYHRLNGIQEKKD